MDLVTLGTSAAYPTVERACSGYLIHDGDVRILMDMGSGVVRNLMRWTDPGGLSAIILSHLHQDHFIDIYPLYYFLAYREVQNLPLDIYAPEGAREFILQIFPPGSERGVDRVYRFKSLEDRGFFDVGGVRCQSIAVKHNLPAFGMRISGKQLLAYSSDTEFDEALFDIASGSDLFICEATKQADYKDVLHLTAKQAGLVAQKSGAKKLMLTHIWPEFDPALSRQMAAEEYGGPIIIAEDNMLISMGS